MEREGLNGRMEVSMMEISLMATSKVKANTTLQT
jgi:hypothetical protein